MAESFGGNTPGEKVELYNVIKQHGYDIFFFEDFDVNAKIIRIKNSQEITNWRKTINIYAVPTSEELDFGVSRSI